MFKFLKTKSDVTEAMLTRSTTPISQRMKDKMIRQKTISLIDTEQFLVPKKAKRIKFADDAVAESDPGIVSITYESPKDTKKKKRKNRVYRFDKNGARRFRWPPPTPLKTYV